MILIMILVCVCVAGIDFTKRKDMWLESLRLLPSRYASETPSELFQMFLEDRGNGAPVIFLATENAYAFGKDTTGLSNVTTARAFLNFW